MICLLAEQGRHPRYRHEAEIKQASDSTIDSEPFDHIWWGWSLGFPKRVVHRCHGFDYLLCSVASANTTSKPAPQARLLQRLVRGFHGDDLLVATDIEELERALERDTLRTLILCNQSTEQFVRFLTLGSNEVADVVHRKTMEILTL